MQELSVLREENAKLRVIHDQFWIVLDEREGFQKEVEQLRQSLPPQHGANSSSSRQYGSSSVGGGEGGSGVASSSLLPSSSSGPSAEQWQAMRTQYDSMSNALQECFDVLLSKELKTTLQKTEIGSRGSVQAFLAWLNLTHDRATALHALVSSRDSVMMGAGTSLSPSRRPALNVYTPQLALGSISKEEKEHLLRELHDAKQEIKQLQEELDRTDVSRLQALDDAQRMHQQVQILSEGVRELRGAYQQVKGQAETSAKHAQLVAKLQEETKQKDTVIQELRHRLSQLQRFSAVGDLSPPPLPQQQQQQQAVGTSNPHHKALAADAARIRQQMNERKRSESMERLDEEGGPTASTPATAKRRSPSNEQNIVLSP
jgi:DNA repair exonuclease SbcCD ATPase subunit